MTNKRAEELAESFVTGNITHVAEHTKRKSSYVAVLCALRKNYSAEIGDDYIRIMRKH